MRRITEQAGVALIVDEIQSGFARTGRMFAFEHAGIVPDVVVLSKAIGGSLPLAVVVYREWLDNGSPAPTPAPSAATRWPWPPVRR